MCCLIIVAYIYLMQCLSHCWFKIQIFDCCRTEHLIVWSTIKQQPIIDWDCLIVPSLWIKLDYRLVSAETLPELPWFAYEPKFRYPSGGKSCAKADQCLQGFTPFKMDWVVLQHSTFSVRHCDVLYDNARVWIRPLAFRRELLKRPFVPATTYFQAFFCCQKRCDTKLAKKLNYVVDNCGFFCRDFGFDPLGFGENPDNLAQCVPTASQMHKINDAWLLQ